MHQCNHSPRGYQNLKAFRSSASLCRDLFWLSRRFPSRLDRSLTVPMRRHARSLTQLITDMWRNRCDHVCAENLIERALDELRLLRQYAVRAQVEEVISVEHRTEIDRRIKRVERQLQRLRRKLAQTA